jgi:hypothetical protein
VLNEGCRGGVSVRSGSDAAGLITARVPVPTAILSGGALAAHPVVRPAARADYAGLRSSRPVPARHEGEQ